MAHLTFIWLLMTIVIFSATTLPLLHNNNGNDSIRFDSKSQMINTSNQESDDEKKQENAAENDTIDLMLPGSLRTVATVACIIVLILGVGGNILVPLVVCRTRELCTNSTNVFLINLSIADLLVLVVCMPTVLIELHSRPEVWMLGEFMCKTVPFVELVVAHGSILTILAISFERYYAICKPLKANYKCTNRRALITICCLWSLALMATVPVLFGTELVQEVYIDGSVVSVCLTKANATWQRLYFLVSIIAFFCLPLVILIVVYCIITRRLSRDDRRLLIASIHSSLTPATVTADMAGLSSSSNKFRSGSLPFMSTASIISDHQHAINIPQKDPVQSLWHPAISLFRGSVGSAGSRCGSSSGPPSQNQPARRNSSMVQAASVARSRRQVIFMLAAVVICFFLCLLPFRLFTLWLLVVTEDDIRALTMERFYSLLYFCRVMIYVNSMLNPLLYAVVSSKFRSALTDTIMAAFYCCLHCCGACWVLKTDPHAVNNQLKPSANHHRKSAGMLSNRRRRFFLMRQSTTLTTATTTTTASSCSLKNNSIRSINTNCLPPSSRFSSSDSIVGAKSQQAASQSQQMQPSSFDSNQTSTNSNSAAAAAADSTESSSQPPRLNAIYSSLHTAEYRRRAMMKRSSRVAIIDEDCDENLQPRAAKHHQTDDVCPTEEQQSRSASVASSFQSIEDLLNDPKFVTNESYV